MFLQVSKYLKIPYKICTELNGKRAGGTLNATVFWLVVAVTIAGKCLVIFLKVIVMVVFLKVIYMFNMTTKMSFETSLQFC